MAVILFFGWIIQQIFMFDGYMGIIMNCFVGGAVGVCSVATWYKPDTEKHLEMACSLLDRILPK